jgi:7-cyano-7-deazaguanine synthase in queuosine biosynthesis
MKSDSLLFFSGGVESTLILETLKDTNLRIVYVYSPWHRNFVEPAKKIAEFYNKKLEIFKIESNTSGGSNVQQLNWYLMVAYLYNKKWPQLKNFYYGLHITDTSLTTKVGLENLENVKRFFKILMPESKFISPFQHKTKKEQYDLIPDSVKNMLHTCNRTDRFCGECSKCVEFLRLIKNDNEAKVKPPPL